MRFASTGGLVERTVVLVGAPPTLWHDPGRDAAAVVVSVAERFVLRWKVSGWPN